MDLSFRRVTSSDYDDVVAIRRGIYFGLDYLAARYHTMMENHQGYVAMDGNKMVGFAFITTVDDGETLLTRASRVHEDYEGKGVYRSLSDYIRKIVSSNTEIKRSAVAMHLDEEADRLVKKGAVFVGKRDFSVFHGSTSTILPRIKDVIENKPLQKDAISRIFQSTKLCSVLFPSDRIVSNWVAYRLLPNNIQYFDSRVHNVIATSVDPENVSGNPLLSVGVLFTCDTGEVICIDFHGNIEDGSKVREHIEKHIKLLIGPQIDNFFIMITNETKMDQTLLYKVMEDFSMTEKLTGINMNMIEENV